MKKVIVLKQSHAILIDPSNYWVSVINAGRYFMLDDVMGENLLDSDCVGRVIGRLMNIADVMALNTASIGFLNGTDSRTEMKLINRYFEQKLPMLFAPKVSLIEETSLQLQERTLDIHKTENDEYFLLDDAKVHGKSKMKKAFCEPGNTAFCPPMVFLSAFGPNEVSIERSQENGGNITYHDRTQMENDFKAGLLHPGDLKTAASSIMFSILESLNQALKADGEAMQASKTLKTYAKKKSK
jgi:tyrosyl-tRNA synthetase